MMTNWKILEGTNPVRVHLTYEDGQEFDVLKSDFDRAFGAMINASADDVRRDFEVKEDNFEFYEIVNLVNEFNTSVTARWSTLDQAIKDMPNHADWWCRKGTGKINRVTITTNPDGSVEISRTLAADYR